MRQKCFIKGFWFSHTTHKNFKRRGSCHKYSKTSFIIQTVSSIQCWQQQHINVILGVPTWFYSPKIVPKGSIRTHCFLAGASNSNQSINITNYHLLYQIHYHFHVRDHIQSPPPPLAVPRWNLQDSIYTRLLSSHSACAFHVQLSTII